MKRLISSPRRNWIEEVEATGLTYHTHPDGPYWAEDAYYMFTSDQIDIIERATNDLHEMFIHAAEHIIENNLFSLLGIPNHAIPMIFASWQRDDFSLYGRFDLAYDGVNPPKLLEYNADTPTALIEAAVTQWNWKETVYPNSDQFNGLHESLITAFKKLPFALLHFTGVKDNLEDNQTISYLMDVATQAGLTTEWLAIDEVGYSDTARDFVDVYRDREIRGLFKLYPWEWLLHEEFGQYLKDSRVQFVEPAWKMLLSNKGILPILWELYPENEYLLAAYRDSAKLGRNYIKKPLLSREGANVSLVRNGTTLIDNPGEYGEEGFIYQEVANIPNFAGYYPVIGSWVINHYAKGMGIREDKSLVTGNLSRFVPHIFI